MPLLDVHVDHTVYKVFLFVEEAKAGQMSWPHSEKPRYGLNAKGALSVGPGASKWTFSVRLVNQRLAETNRPSNVLVEPSGISDQAQPRSAYAIRSSLMAAATGMIELKYIVMLQLLALSAASTER